jgi:hypothetical protein
MMNSITYHNRLGRGRWGLGEANWSSNRIDCCSGGYLRTGGRLGDALLGLKCLILCMKLMLDNARIWVSLFFCIVPFGVVCAVVILLGKDIGGFVDEKVDGWVDGGGF